MILKYLEAAITTARSGLLVIKQISDPAVSHSGHRSNKHLRRGTGNLHRHRSGECSRTAVFERRLRAQPVYSIKTSFQDIHRYAFFSTSPGMNRSSKRCASMTIFRSRNRDRLEPAPSRNLAAPGPDSARTNPAAARAGRRITKKGLGAGPGLLYNYAVLN